MKRFDRKHPREDFKRLTHIKQDGSVESDINDEFQRISLRATIINEDRLTYLLIDGSEEPLKELVSALKPEKLEDAFVAALNSESSSNNRSRSSHTKTFHKGDESYPRESFC